MTDEKRNNLIYNFLKCAKFTTLSFHDYKDFEIKDLENNNEILKQKICDGYDKVIYFGSHRNVTISLYKLGIYGSETNISINYGTTLKLTYTIYDDGNIKYEIITKSKENNENKVLITFEKEYTPNINNTADRIIIDINKGNKQNYKIKHMRTKCYASNLEVEKESYIYDETLEDNNTTYNTAYKKIKTSNINENFYLKLIFKYLNNDKELSEDLNFNYALNFILPMLDNNCKETYYSYITNIDKIINLFEKQKEKEKEEYEKTIAKIDNSINELKNISMLKDNVRKRKI